MKRLLLQFGTAMGERLVPSLGDLELLCQACEAKGARLDDVLSSMGRPQAQVASGLPEAATQMALYNMGVETAVQGCAELAQLRTACARPVGQG
ncbi:hypothetical protein AACH06_25545 [Ideonella sp. DXS29W]|uniref:Uncharacterized protein n=1 Tax=Ideonella lacteola TaxID=2984193 RepID=A0ABU9C045_9BURK